MISSTSTIRASLRKSTSPSTHEDVKSCLKDVEREATARRQCKFQLRLGRVKPMNKLVIRPYYHELMESPSPWKLRTSAAPF